MDTPVTETTETTNSVTNTEVTVNTVGMTIDLTKLPSMEEVEKKYLLMLLERTGGDKAKTAKIMGYSVKTVYNKIELYKQN